MGLSRYVASWVELKLVYVHHLHDPSATNIHQISAEHTQGFQLVEMSSQP
jgi:hypothetical protein